MARIGVEAGQAAQAEGISAGQQFAAVARLRWWLFRNGFRRKGGKGELAARIIVFPVALAFLVGPVVGTGFATYGAVSTNHLEYLGLIFAVIFGLQIVVSINISPPAQSFDPESLIRYPVTFTRYLTIRLFLGLMSASTVVGTLCLLAAAVVATVARPALAAIVFTAALSLALANMLFVRMVFAWIDRWLSTRRAREIVTILVFTFSIGIQYLNVTFNNLGHKYNHAQQQARYEAVSRFFQHALPYLMALPPGLAGSSVVAWAHGSQGLAVLEALGVLVYAGLCLAIFGWRMQREYRGENLSEGSVHNAQVLPRDAQVQPVARRVSTTSSGGGATVPASAYGANEASVIPALLNKEWLYVRRNPAQFYGLIAPLAMVFIFAGRLGRFAQTGLVFPAAAAYSVLGVAALAYNLLGMDAAGVQFYFLSPVTFRSIMLAKNLFGFGITALQIVLLYIVLLFTTGAPPLLVAISTVCWIVFAALVNAAIGNIRSITAPKKVDPGKVSRKQASQLSALMSLGLMLVVGGLGAGVIALSQLMKMPWLPIPIFLALAVGAFALYWAGLNRLDAMAMNHREGLIEELSKVSV